MFAPSKFAPLFAVLAACLALFIAGCNTNVSGTYSAEMMGTTMTLELKSGGAAVVTMVAGGQTEKKEGTYTVSGDTVTINIEKGEPATFVKQKDGSLAAQGQMNGLTLKKK